MRHIPYATVLLVLTAPLAAVPQERASVKLDDAEHVIVYRQDGIYAVFPFMPERQPEDGIIVSLSARTNPSHDDPSGGVVVMRSTDGCRTWELHQHSEGDVSPEDVGTIQALPTADGALVSVYAGWEYYPEESRGELEAAGHEVASAREGLIGALTAHRARVSRDGGLTWEEKDLPMPNSGGVMAFHGGIVTDQDIILWPVYGAPSPGDTGHSYVYRSDDSGETWTFHHIIGDSTGRLPLNETSLLDLGGGHILAFVRTGDEVDHMFRAESFNGGITWGRYADSGVRGHPPHLLRLRNGHILLTYGYRHSPFGIRAVISKDNGRTWGDEFILRDDGMGGDLGYPMSIQLEDDTLFTVYYIRSASGGPTHVAGTLWREPE